MLLAALRQAAWCRTRSCPNMERSNSSHGGAGAGTAGRGRRGDSARTGAAVAFRSGQRVSFTRCPTQAPPAMARTFTGASSTRPTSPALYDERRALGLSAAGSRFVAGILHYLPALCAVTARRIPSYYGCGPIAGLPCNATSGRWTAARRCGSARRGGRRGSARARVQRRVSGGRRHRESLSRARRAGAAGLEGIRRDMSLERHKPQPLARVVAQRARTPRSLRPAAEWLGADVLSAYLRFKRAEIAAWKTSMKRRSAAAMPKFIETGPAGNAPAGARPSRTALRLRTRSRRRAAASASKSVCRASPIS